MLAANFRRSEQDGYDYFFAIFIVALAAHFVFALSGWNNPIDACHTFRQSQSAIAAYYVINNGFSLFYLTPVLGKPWSVPIEFPLYQWTVAAMCMIFGLGIDQAGRFVNLAFFYLFLSQVFLLLKRVTDHSGRIFLFLSFMLASPLYIFMSRTIMRESMLAFFCALYVVLVVRDAERPRWTTAAAAALAGSIAGALRLVTPVPYLIFAALLYCREFFARDKVRPASGSFIFRETARVLLIFGSPLLVSLMWWWFAQAVSTHNPFARGIVGNDFVVNTLIGGVRGKPVLEIWGTFYRHGLIFVIGECFFKRILFMATLPILLAVFAYSAIKRPGNCVKALGALGLLFTSPLIARWYYCVHNYAWYGGGVFTVAFVWFLLVPLLDGKRSRTIAKFILVPAILFSMYSHYFNNYYYSQVSTERPDKGVAAAIRQYTDEDDIILIYGYDWSPEVPYYAQRKALMDRWSLGLENEKIKEALTLLGDSRIRAMVVGSKYYKMNEVFSDKKYADYKAAQELLFGLLSRGPTVKETAGFLRWPEKKVSEMASAPYKNPLFTRDFIGQRVALFGLHPQPVFESPGADLYVSEERYQERGKK